MSTTNRLSPGALEAVLQRYATPSEAYWRALELEALRQVVSQAPPAAPVLEIGCGDGWFASRLFSRIDTAVELNPRAVERARARGIYGEVHCADACNLSLPAACYATVFSNCVLEHVSDSGAVLAAACRVLRPAGKLIATVPLEAMNDHLVLRSRRYARYRQRQLVHVNLHDVVGWGRALCAAGFAAVSFVPYLYAADVRLWDGLDLPASIGTGRYRVSTLVNAALPLVPNAVRAGVRRLSAIGLARAAERRRCGEPCAVVVVATK